MSILVCTPNATLAYRPPLPFRRAAQALIGSKVTWTRPHPPLKTRIADGPMGWACALGGRPLIMHWEWEIDLPGGKTKAVPATELYLGWPPTK